MNSIFLTWAVARTDQIFLKPVHCSGYKPSVKCFPRRFFFGKNRVMQLALGRTEEEEYRENLHKLTRHVQGQTGLLFTNATEKEVLR